MIQASRLSSSLCAFKYSACGTSPPPGLYWILVGVRGFVPQDADTLRLPGWLRAGSEGRGEHQEGENGAEPGNTWFHIFFMDSPHPQARDDIT